MSDLITVTGNLTSTPERRELAGGVVMATFGVASTERRLENGVWNDVHTNFFDVAVYRRLAEHALASLERGQRVIVVGKLKIRRWETNGRSGTTVDLEASCLGPDLKFGTASFLRDSPASVAPETPPSASAERSIDAWAAPGAPYGTPEPRAGIAATAGESGSRDAVAVLERASESADAQPTSADGWPDDSTPF